MNKFNADYFQTGNYADYLKRYKRYETTAFEIKELVEEPILDFGCAVGFLVLAFENLNIEIQGYDISSWAIQYGKNVLGAKNLTDQWSECQNNYNTLIALDVFEHMKLAEVATVLANVGAKRIIVRMPVANKKGEDFALDIARRDTTHQTCLSKEEWDSFFEESGYKLEKVLDFSTIWDAMGALSRSYVKI